MAQVLNATTTSTLSPEMKTFYDKDLIRNAKPILVHNQFGQKRNIPKNGGKTIEFRKFSPLPKALTPLTEGVTPDGQALTVTNLTAQVSQYGDYVALGHDLLKSVERLVQTAAGISLVDGFQRLACPVGQDFALLL